MKQGKRDSTINEEAKNIAKKQDYSFAARVCSSESVFVLILVDHGRHNHHPHEGDGADNPESERSLPLRAYIPTPN